MYFKYKYVFDPIPAFTGLHRRVCYVLGGVRTFLQRLQVCMVQGSITTG